MLYYTLYMCSAIIHNKYFEFPSSGHCPLLIRWTFSFKPSDWLIFTYRNLTLIAQRSYHLTTKATQIVGWYPESQWGPLKCSPSVWPKYKKTIKPLIKLSLLQYSIAQACQNQFGNDFRLWWYCTIDYLIVNYIGIHHLFNHIQWFLAINHLFCIKDVFESCGERGPVLESLLSMR